MNNSRADNAHDFRVTFWGTRGTRMVTEPGYKQYGRNTICIEVNCGGRVIIFDAGSGLIYLGSDLIERNIKNIDLFLSHSHYDHVEGIPFFQPFYNKNFKVNFWSGRLKGAEHARQVIDDLMKEPYFPISMEKFQAKILYHDIADFESIQLSYDIEIQTTRLHHPGGATGYRLNFAGKSFAFITDTTHAVDQRDFELSEFIKDVDLLVYDCSYLDEEFAEFASYGHSTWEEAIRLKKISNAKLMYGLHHMPFRNDEALKQIEEQILAKESNCHIAKDHDSIIL